MACEFSGRVREAFRSLGHDAWSCDLLPALDGSKRHLRCDVREVLGDGWDLMIAHPPCTYLTSAVGRLLRLDRNRMLKSYAAGCFARDLFNCGITCVAVENPVGILPSYIGPYAQIIHPWMFGDPYKKRTCLWLKGLKPLIPNTDSDVLRSLAVSFIKSRNTVDKYTAGHISDLRLPRNLARSMTFPGIARAMAEQWGGVEI